jgi:hypothetical protein
MSDTLESNNLSPLNFDLERDQYDRRQFIKNASVSIGAIAAANFLMTDQALAQITSNIPADLEKNGDSEIDDEMLTGINICVPTPQDITLMNSKEFDFNVLWAPGMENVIPHHGHNELAVLEESKSNFSQIQNSGNTFISVPSNQLPEWYAKKEHAPDNVGVKSPLGDYFRLIFDKYAEADFVIPENEPDLAYKANRQLAPIKAAQIMITADKIAQETGYKGVLLGPASSDTIDNYGADFLKEYTDYLNYLGYEFKTETALCTHAYKGIKDNDDYGIRSADSIAKHSYRSDNKKIYIPESGNTFKTTETKITDVFEYAKTPTLLIQEVKQAKHMIDMYRKCRKIGVGAIANYTFFDSQNGGGGWMCGYYNYDGKPHLIYYMRNHLK